MKASHSPFIITGLDVLGEILRRNEQREAAARDWSGCTHTARLGDKETVESNLPLRSQPSTLNHQPPQ